MRAFALSIFCVLALAAEAPPQAEKPRLNFSEYPARHVYQGKPAQPILNKDQRMFRTMIRSGAQSPVEFAGHYTVPMWGCGSGCNEFAIVDSITGRVYDAPFSLDELPMSWEDQHSDHVPERMEFHADSRLMKINACPNEENCGFYDYVMVDGEGLKLRRKEILPKEFQY
jgi:hypothetical protein